MTRTNIRNSVIYTGICLFLASTLVFTGCDNGQKAVANVNGATISQSEFDDNFKRFFSMHTGMKNPNELKGSGTEALVINFKKEAMDFLVQEKLLAEEVAKRKLTVGDDEVNAIYRRATSAGGLTEAAFEETLKEHDLTKDSYKALIRKQLAAEKLALAIQPKAGEVSDNTIQQYFSAHRKEYEKPPMVEARHILIQAKSTSATDKADAKKKAEDLLAKVQAKPDTFAFLAKEHSTDKGSAQNGGDLGYFSADMMVAPFSKAAFSTAVGQITPYVVESQFGFHIIQVTGKNPAQTASLAALKDGIQETLRQQQISKVLDAWLTTKKAASKITYSAGYDFEAEMRKAQADFQKETQKAAPKGK